MSKTNSRVLSDSGKSVYVIQHEGVEVKGDIFLAVPDAGVVVTEFSLDGLYVVIDNTDSRSGIFAATSSVSTLSLEKLSGPVLVTDTKDTALSLNAYIEDGVLKVQNLTTVTVDITVKPYV